MINYKIGLLGHPCRENLGLIEGLSGLELGSIFDGLEEESVFNPRHFKLYNFKKGLDQARITRIESESMDEEELDRLMERLGSLDFLSGLALIYTSELMMDLDRVYIDLPLVDRIDFNEIFTGLEVYETTGFVKGELGQDKFSSEIMDVNLIAINHLNYMANPEELTPISMNSRPFKIMDLSKLSRGDKLIYPGFTLEKIKRDFELQLSREFAGFILFDQ